MNNHVPSFIYFGVKVHEMMWLGQSSAKSAGA